MDFDKERISIDVIKKFDLWYRALYLAILIGFLVLLFYSTYESHKYNQPVTIQLKIDKIATKDTAYANGIVRQVRESIVAKNIQRSVELDKSVSDKSNVVFGVILAGIALLFSIVVVIPKVLIKQAISDEVSEVQDKLQAKINAEYKNQLSVHANTIDAHHARLITYLLLRDHLKLDTDSRDTLWAIGWAARSLKNYLRIFNQDNVLGEPLNVKNYGVFVTDVCTSISLACAHLLHLQDATVEPADDYMPELFNGISPANWPNNIKRKKLFAITKLISSNNKIEKDSGTNLAIRTVKEVFDTHYMISDKMQNDKVFANHLHIFYPLAEVSDVIFMLVICLIQSGNIVQSNHLHNKWTVVARKIVSVSNNTNDPNFHKLVDSYVRNCYNALYGYAIDNSILSLEGLFKFKFIKMD